MTTYRIITVLTEDTRAPRYTIMETREGGEERVVSEHQTEDEAVEEIAELRTRVDFWRSGK